VLNKRHLHGSPVAVGAQDRANGEVATKASRVGEIVAGKEPAAIEYSSA
jgi:hypothetical protein